MPTQKYLFLYRGSPRTGQPQPEPSPAQMQEMFAAWNAWKERFKDNILDMGAKLKRTGKVLTASEVTDGPHMEGKEVVGGYMIVVADSYERALTVGREMPGMDMPGARLEIRELEVF